MASMRQGEARPAPGRHVLLVEDDDDIREALRGLLEGEGYQVSEAPNGADGLAILAAANPLPCVALVDLMMPILDGWQFLERVREDPRFAGLEVVVITAATEPQIPVGPVVLRKPFSVDALLAAVARACTS